MNVRFCAVLCRLAGLRWLFLATLLVLSAVRRAIAQWTTADAQTAFSNYNNGFYFNSSGNNYDYRVQQAGTGNGTPVIALTCSGGNNGQWALD